MVDSNYVVLTTWRNTQGKGRPESKLKPSCASPLHFRLLHRSLPTRKSTWSSFRIFWDRRRLCPLRFGRGGTLEHGIIHTVSQCCNLSDLPDKEIAVANIDVDMYEATLVALYKIAPRMVLGGAVLLEDMTWWAEGWNGDRICDDLWVSGHLCVFRCFGCLESMTLVNLNGRPKSLEPCPVEANANRAGQVTATPLHRRAGSFGPILRVLWLQVSQRWVAWSNTVDFLLNFKKLTVQCSVFRVCLQTRKSLVGGKKSSCFVFKVWNGLGLHQSLCARGSNVDSHPSLKSLRWSKSGFPTRWNNLPTNHTSNCTTEYRTGRTL